MILYIVRHAWAGEHGDPRWPNDAERPLTDEGSVRFAKVAKKLAKRGVRPRVVGSSPLVRTRQTAELLISATGKPPLVLLDALAPGSDLPTLLTWTALQAKDEIAWVGHAPDVSDLTAALIGDAGAGIEFNKGACAAIEFDGEPQAGHGRLLWFVTAKILNC